MIVLIPARGGSKRIPEKNIKTFLGTPIITRVINELKVSNFFDEVYVTTDSNDIKCVAEMAGGKVPYIRSKKSASDDATLHEAVCEFIIQHGLQNRHEIMAVALPTAVLLTSSTIAQSINDIQSGKYSSTITVSEFETSPLKALSISADGCLEKPNFFSDNARSQTLLKYYKDAGQFYTFFTDEVVDRNSLVSNRCKPVILGKLMAQDIDYPEDWMMAEMKFQYLER